MARELNEFMGLNGCEIYYLYLIKIVKHSTRLYKATQGISRGMDRLT